MVKFHNLSFHGQLLTLGLEKLVLLQSQLLGKHRLLVDHDVKVLLSRHHLLVDLISTLLNPDNLILRSLVETFHLSLSSHQ